MRGLTHVGGPAREERRPPPPAPPRKPLSEDGLDGAFQPCAPAALVRIYEMEKEWGFPYWLCPTAAAEFVAQRWTIRKHRAPPFDDLPCYVHGNACPAPLS